MNRPLSFFEFRLSTLFPRVLRLSLHLCLSVFICVPLFLSSAQAATLTGTVRNGTTGQPAAGVDIVLIALQGGMETVANTKTDAQGRFTLENPSIGAQPMLVRALYRGVNFHASLPPGRTSADIEVFDPTRDPRVLQIPSRLIVFQPNGATLLVGEEYTVNNSAKPPAAFFKPDGTFDFELPSGATLGQVSAWGPSGMPTVQGTIDRGPQRYSVAFPFRPGESGVRVAYQLPYSDSAARLRLSTGVSAARVVLIAPPSVQVSAAGFAAAGSQDGWNVYARDSVSAGTLLDVSLSGTAPPPSDSPAGQGSGRGGSQIASQTLPSRLGNLQWILVIGFAALFVIGVIFLWRRPVAAVASGLGADLPVPASLPTLSRASPLPAPDILLPAETSPSLADSAMSDLDRIVAASLADLKEALFRLELRHQAGTISDNDYQHERSRVESRLRSLLHG